MKIQEKDWFHGSALAQISEHESFTALNKASEKYGHYQVNHNKRVLLKYSSAENGPWQFTFQQDDVEIIADDINADIESFICLVCGYDTICILDEDEIEVVLDLESDDVQWIRIEYPPGGSMRARGSEGELDHTVPHNAFPSKLFE